MEDSDVVVFKIEHQVDISSDEAHQIYAAVTNAMLNGGFQGVETPLRIRSNQGSASIGYVDYEGSVIGYQPISDAVSELMLFDAKLFGGDVDVAVKEAIEVATAFEVEAARIRQRIAELRA